MKILKTTVRILLWLAVCQLPALLSAPIVQTNMDWYHTLTRPPLVPPDWVFGLVWAMLYVLLGLSAAVAFRPTVRGPKRRALVLFLAQLALNACWTPVYFGLHNLAAALLIILMMLGEGILLHRALAKLDARAAYLLVPYWAWLLFAAYLTAGFIRLN